VKKRARRKSKGFTLRHGLSLVSGGILLTWLVLYIFSDEQNHWGSFFGNAIADWTGVVVTVLATKHLYEAGSRESKKPPSQSRDRLLNAFRRHSLTIFLLITGVGWVIVFARSNPQGKWGQVIGNIVSEWTQLLGMVIMTKKLIEVGSKEDSSN
jgi:hypothetical protein